MSSNTSPSHYVQDAFVTDADFKVDINQRMKVPQKISFSSEMNGDLRNSWVMDNFSMQVPERILVVGQDQHIGKYYKVLTVQDLYKDNLGTRAPPREIAFDNSMLARSSEPYLNDLPRVATPPRNLTLDKYPFPGNGSLTGFLQIINVVDVKGINDYQGDSEPEDQLPVVKPKQKAYLNLNDSTHLMSNSFREATPPIGKFVTVVCAVASTLKV